MLKQARRSSTTTPPLPSSPPSAFVSAGKQEESSEARGVPSPAQSLWSAPSPTQTLGYSSPELPPLAPFSGLQSFPRSPSTLADHERRESASYFTASWGSPYRHPPPSLNRNRIASNSDSDDLDDDSSSVQFGLEHLLPRPLEDDGSPGRFTLDHLLPQPLEQEGSPNQFNLEHLIPSRLLGLETPTRDIFSTQTTSQSNTRGPQNTEWVRQFLDGRWNKAKNDWLTDTSSSGESKTADAPGKQLGLPAKRVKKKTHKARRDNKTLNQKDFWSHFSKRQIEQLGKMMASRFAPEAPSAPARKASNGSLRSATAQSDTTAGAPEPSRHPVTPNKFLAPPEPATTPRPRKKVMVKGKGCVISLPRDIPRGAPGYPPKPMSPQAVEAKLRQFEQDGFEVRRIGGQDALVTPPQNRPIWPDEADILADRSGSFRVRVPNKADWDAYVEQLVEAKLAALGVNLGEEEEAPLSAPASAQALQHPGLPFSPPLPSSSAGSHRLRQGSIAGPFPMGPSPGHVSRQSMASPMTIFPNQRASMHMHRHSTFSPASFLQQSASPTGAWSPANYFGAQGNRGASPAAAMGRPDLAEGVSPVSPFGMRPNQPFPPPGPPQRDDMLVQMQQQQQQLQAQLLHQQQQQQQQLLGLRPSSTLAEVPEDEAEEQDISNLKHAQHNPDIAIPAPRGHRHNISANLEREARDAEYHLEEVIDKQFNDGGDFSTEPETTSQLKPSNVVANSTWEGSRPVLHQPQPHNRAHSLAQPSQSLPFGYSGHQQDNPRGDSDGARTNISDVTNPSLENEPHRAGQPSNFNFGKPSTVGHSKHTSRSSISKLNVEAKEFKFNPGASFNPGSISSVYSATAAEPAPRSVSDAAKFNVAAPAFKPDAPVFQPQAPVLQPSAPAFTPSAPAFTPSAPTFTPSAPAFTPSAPTFTPRAANASAMPTSGFSFSSPGSTFKPDAPVFNPSSSSLTPAQPSAPASFTSTIFGPVTISADDIVQPAKRSKAVPILRPVSRDQTPQAEDKEDEDGRITQADGREKRARRVRDDSDDVPRFAIQPVLRPKSNAGSNVVQSAKDDQVERDTIEGKENASPVAEKTSSKPKTPEPLSLRESEPVEASMATPDTEKSTDMSTSRTPIDDGTPHESDVIDSDAHTPTVEEAPKSFTRTHRSSLSATAKPFEYRPGASADYDFGYHVTKPSYNEQFENNFASPVRNASRSPATTFRPSDDGSFRTALETRRRAPYPESESVDFDLGQASFNDIDAVMKHMNEVGSDFGVERDEPSWEESSPRVPQDFVRNDLRPNANMRSDAPSPSPRRAIYRRQSEATPTAHVQNPFDDERVGMAYSPVHRLNNAEDVSLSEWDGDLLPGEEEKIEARSRFFDTHVDSLLSNLLQAHLDPLKNELRDIQDSFAYMSQRRVGGRRSFSDMERMESDADDEDDEVEPVSSYRNRSPRKDRKLEKLRMIVKEALETYSPPSASAIPDLEAVLPEKIREIIVDALTEHRPTATPAEPLQPDNVRNIIMEALAHHQPQWTPPKFEPVPADQIRSIVEEAIMAHQPVQGPAETVKADDIRSIVAEVVAASISKPSDTAVEPVQRDDIRSIVMEALAAHTPQSAPVEQVGPDAIRDIITEALEQRAPTAEPIQPETLRSIVADALASHAPVTPVPEPVQPDTIRAIVDEALASHKPPTLEAPIDIPQPQVDLSEIYQVIGSLKASIAQTTSHNLQAEDVRELLEEAFKRQSMEIAKREEAQAIQERDARIADLEDLLAESSKLLEAESQERKELQGREADRERLLKITEEELALLRESTGDDEVKIRALEDECGVMRRTMDALYTDDKGLKNRVAALESENEQLKMKSIAIESSEVDLQKRLDAVTAENEALAFTLEEHRKSADTWRNEIKKAHEDAERMRKAIEQSRFQAEEAARLRETMRAKFEKLQQDMVIAAGQAADERARWQKNDEAHLKKYEVLSARIEAEARTRERLERELERLETQEREAMKLRFNLEQSQKHTTKLEETVEQLRKESLEHRQAAERFERDYREAREVGHVEVRRTRVLLEADIEAANNQVNIVRADLEAEIARIRGVLDNVRMDADTLKAKHELELEAATDAQKAAVAEAQERSKLALREQEQLFERRLEKLSEEQDRALAMAREDKDRAESYFKDRLSLADSKMEHLHEKLQLMEERLNIAKEAASAAAAAAQRVPSPSSTGTGPEKISPQALRESIAVLQEQLQERESRIESLEQKLTEVDTEAPAKLKERDTEITWLRELLGVRIDDLNDLIAALAQPTFNRETVRDAAIRIRTNLQMEQQEKERLISGNGNPGQAFPTLATLSNFASPKAVQLAAAFGSWRKGRDSVPSTRNSSGTLAGSGSSSRSQSQTPSRTSAPPPNAAQSFLSGLMTPPTSNARRMNPDHPLQVRPTRGRPQPLRVHLNAASESAASDKGFPSLGKVPVPVNEDAGPRTPPSMRGNTSLLRVNAYDADAMEDGGFSESGFYDDESTVDGEVTPVGAGRGREGGFGMELQAGVEGRE
ncbi:hypothetical protein M011DRAFT_468513 [Sporormia fimetaria CBS 119925]|uniref:Myosin class II heavy chain n=1 Tax=Sporormia fimetaria CBS 119925 TaxID=1340428 RepID=A0A6A6VB99_9PLEO|nr:hypothetical protein M011DRAFT_468513 [Sporormia fimetaria CBS 119925]